MTRRAITLGSIIAIFPAIFLILSLAAGPVFAGTFGPDDDALVGRSVLQAEGSTPALIRALGDLDIEVRWKAAVSLVKAGRTAVPPLIGALTDANVYVRQGAARVLGDIGQRTTEVTASLIKTMSDPDPKVREFSAEALGKLGKGGAASIKALIAALSDIDPFVVGQSTASLGMSGREALPSVMAVLQDKNERVRAAALVAIGKMGDAGQAAIPGLMAALNDGSADVRWHAANDLGALGPLAREAASALLARLSDPDQDVRWAADLALDMVAPGSMDKAPDMRSTAAVIDSLVPELMKELHIPGVSIALVENGGSYWTGNYGTARAGENRPVTDGTLFEACSMTKPVFAYIALKLAEQGKLDLDKPLISYLPGSDAHMPPQEERGRITARMALSHTTGFPNWRKGEDELDGPLPIQFPPGSRFGYSGEGIFLLQRVVERITGEPLEIYARRTLFQPLGSKHMSFVWTEGLEAGISAGHDDKGAFLQKTKYTHANAAYSLYTSAADYALFLAEIMKADRSAGHSLSRKYVAEMLSPQVKLDSREPIERPGKAWGKMVYWGLGWSMNETAAGFIFHHSGSNRSGFRCFAQFNPGRGTGIVIMTNGTNGSEFWTRLIARIGNY